MKVFGITFGLLALLQGITSEAQSGPYPPSGWRPSGPAFNPAPTPQRQSGAQYGAPPVKYDIEVSKERLEYAGPGLNSQNQNQYQNYPIHQNQNQRYTSQEYPVNQNYPTTQIQNQSYSSQQNQNQKQSYPTNQEYQSNQVQNQDYPTSQIQNQNPLNQNVNYPSNQNQGYPSNQNQRYPTNQNQGYPTNQNQGNPASSYGPPQATTTERYEPPTTQDDGLTVQGLPSNGRPPVFRKQRIQVSRKALKQQYGEPSTTAQYDDQTTESVTSRNQQEIEEENNEEKNMANAFATGQYYVLLPNNQLQRVVYEATQTKDEQQMNGYSAQIKYQNVEPIRDPIYSYNSFGQLVRISK